MSQDRQKRRVTARKALLSELDRRLGLPDQNPKFTAASLERLEEAVIDKRRKRDRNR